MISSAAATVAVPETKMVPTATAAAVATMTVVLTAAAVAAAVHTATTDTPAYGSWGPRCRRCLYKNIRTNPNFAFLLSPSAFSPPHCLCS